MYKKLLVLFGLIAATAYATDRFQWNPESNGDFKIKANIGGTATDVLTVTGSTGIITASKMLNNSSMPAFRADLNGSNATYNSNAGFFDLNWNDSGSANAFDQASNFAAGSNGLFTVPTGGGGIYLVIASIQWINDADLVAGGLYGLRCYKNTSTSVVITDQFLQVAGRGFERASSALVSLAAGDTLNCRAVSNQNHSTNTVVISGDVDSTYWSATKIH